MTSHAFFYLFSSTQSSSCSSTYTVGATLSYTVLLVNVPIRAILANIALKKLLKTPSPKTMHLPISISLMLSIVTVATAHCVPESGIVFQVDIIDVLLY